MDSDKRTRRNLLKSLTAGVLRTAVPTKAQTTTTVGLFLPGIMGSHIVIGNNSSWSNDPRDLFETMLSYPSLLKNTEGAQTKIVETIKVPLTPFEYPVYKQILQALDFHFNAPGRLFLKFPYNWTLSIDDIIERFHDRITQLKIPSSYYCFGHSLGALILLLAIHRKILPIQSIRRLVLIAPPLLGAPEAFRQLYDGLPVLPKARIFHWLHPSAQRSFREVLAELPCCYQLMPPAGQKYVINRRPTIKEDLASWFTSTSSGAFQDAHKRELTNPLETDWIPEHRKALNRKIYTEVSEGIMLAAENLIGKECRLHIITTKQRLTDRFYWVFKSGQSIVIEKGVPFEEGDKTVPEDLAMPPRILSPEVAERVHFEVTSPTKDHWDFCEDESVLKKVQQLLDLG